MECQKIKENSPKLMLTQQTFGDLHVSIPILGHN